jgi:hypothetical protein
MGTPPLGVMERVDLRQAWISESGDFTPWLAQNLKMLGETIGLSLELEAQEKNVGPFRADILCRETSRDDHWVLIENQLERTDHGHLGQLLTYAAGLKAVTIVWIAERFTEEHRAALDWLNEITDERFGFFGLELELWRIGTSPVAPKFNVISKPNDWARQIQDAARKPGEVTDHKQRQLQFWMAFKEYMDERRSPVRCQKPQPAHWMNHAIGRSGFKMSSVVSSWNSETNTREPEIRAEMVVDDNNYSKEYFAQLYAQKDEIEKAIGQPLTWHNPEDAKACRIYVRRSANFLNPAEWAEQHEWLRINLEKLQHVFAPRVRQLDPARFSSTSVLPSDGSEAGMTGAQES